MTFGFSLFSLTICAEDKPRDLSGLWVRDDGGIVRISQEGATIKAVHVEVSKPVREEFEFHPGDTHVLAALEGRTIRGKMQTHYSVKPVNFKALCPGQWVDWADLELDVSPDGDTLEGRWKHKIMTSQGCSVIKEEWLPRRYTRLLGAEGGLPGLLSVTARGQRLRPFQLELILDASGSMWEKIGGRPKIRIAQDVLSEVIDQLPDDLDVALRVYGHRIAPGRSGACQDSELVVPFAKLDRPQMRGRIRAIRALGTTPIDYSLRQVADDFGGKAGEKMVVLVTDGIEECKGRPSSAVSELLAKGLDVRINIVGFAFTDDASKLEMRRVAELSRGRFLDARDATGLRTAIEQALAVPYDVFDGKEASAGAGLVDQGPLRVSEGLYKVVVRLPDAPLTVEGVRVESSKSTRVELVREGGQMAGHVVGP
ncbi:MAG: VWA domain-containing protein [Thermoanaerobaculia bacterium]